MPCHRLWIVSVPLEPWRRCGTEAALQEPIERRTHVFIACFAHHAGDDLAFSVDHHGSGNDVTQPKFFQRIEIRARPDVEIDLRRCSSGSILSRFFPASIETATNCNLLLRG